MKIELTTENEFYYGWIAYIFGLPRDINNSKTFQLGWDTGFETTNIREDWDNPFKQAQMGRLYMALLAELSKDNVKLTHTN